MYARKSLVKSLERILFRDDRARREHIFHFYSQKLYKLRLQDGVFNYCKILKPSRPFQIKPKYNIRNILNIRMDHNYMTPFILNS